jgi:nucleoside 2-deoxyribosyltransferase
MKKIYLAGPISGLTYDGAQDWRNKFSAAIDDRIECFSPLRGKDYLTMRGKLEGSYEEFPLSTDQGITTRDRYDCMGADLVVFYMLGATERVSIGTMIELGWADAMRRPAILIMEKAGEKPLLSEIDAAWLAALIDGEGNIGFQRRGNYWAVRLTINMQSKETVEKAAAITKFGSVLLKKRGKRERRDSWRWTIASKEAISVLLAVYPYLIEKKPMAAIALEMEQTVDSQRRFQSNPGKFQALPPEEVSIREEIAQRFKLAIAREPVGFPEPKLPVYSNIHDHPMVRQTTHFRVDNLNDAVALSEIILLGKAKQPTYYDAEPMTYLEVAHREPSW